MARADIGRRRFCALASTLAGAAGAPRGAAAQGDYPSRPVTVVVPWGAGGSTDIFARVLAARLAGDLGKPFPVDNRFGANGTIGFASVARARPDGHTLLVGTVSTYAMAPHLYQLPYDNEGAFAGVGQLGRMPIMMLVAKGSPAGTLAEYVALAKRGAAGGTYANAGSGASTHLATELFLQRAGIEVTDVGYRGSAAAIQGVMAGEVGMTFAPSSAAIGFVQSGNARALAVTSGRRTPLVPDVPTVAESGFPGYEVVEDLAMLAPAGTPAPILSRLNAACGAALDAPEVRERLAALAIEPGVRPPDEWPAHLAAENRKWREVIRSRNIRVQ